MAIDLDRHYGKTVERLYSQRSWLILLANSYIQDIETSEDIVNDSFMAFLEHIDKLDESVYRSYLAMTVKNRCLNWLKRANCERIIYRNMRVKAIDAYNISLLEDDKMDSRMYGKEVMGICRETLGKMGPLTSGIFMDRLAGLSYKEIAEKYGITQRSVTYEISKVLAVLKENLRDYFPIVLMALMIGRN